MSRRRWENLKIGKLERDSKPEKAHCLSGAARFITDRMSVQEFEREGMMV